MNVWLGGVANLGRHHALIATGRRIAPVFGMRFGEVGIRYVFTLMLAASLGVDGTGQFYIGISIITVAASIARLGIDSAAVKQVAISTDRHDLAGARDLSAFSISAVVILGGVTSLAIFCTSEPIAALVFGKPALAPLLHVAAFGTLALAVQTTVGGLLTAADRPVIGQFVAAVAWPLATTVYLLVVGLGTVSPGTAMAVAVGAMALSSLGGLFALWARLGRRLPRRPTLDGSSLIAVALPLCGVELVYLLINNLPIVALGMLGTDRDVGLLGLASRVSMLLTVFTVAMYAVTAPRFARLYASADGASLKSAANQLDARSRIGNAPICIVLSRVTGNHDGAVRHGLPRRCSAARGAYSIAVGECPALAMSHSARDDGEPAPPLAQCAASTGRRRGRPWNSCARVWSAWGGNRGRCGYCDHEHRERGRSA